MTMSFGFAVDAFRTLLAADAPFDSVKASCCFGAERNPSIARYATRGMRSLS